MCIILIIENKDYNRHTKTIDEYLENARTSNPHGAGVALISHKGTTVHKGLHLVVPNILKKDEWETAVVHYRYATHGKIDDENSHPFYTGYGWLFHNGVWNYTAFQELGNYGDNMSDTAIVAKFFKDFKIPMLNQFNWLNKQSSKYVYIVGDNKIYHNLQLVDKQTGILASNSSYESLKYKVYPVERYIRNGSYYGHSWYAPRLSIGELYDLIRISGNMKDLYNLLSEYLIEDKHNLYKKYERRYSKILNRKVRINIARLEDKAYYAPAYGALHIFIDEYISLEDALKELENIVEECKD